ncbi:DUF4124 domain-containing protein [Caenorhabditis elegans]|uniref:DUF4124 domain-containing protein n=1 Tax=Caenorhabditis elegans TaxID=6239 RepID=Q8MYM3_CAEEL|nr:DUF4124 domain-containing protein [Caenorhabditis elegans]CAD31833.4 DUF4124 domain-containing protein [Caenorhabditis elegans]|eukprot:NP_741652.3 Uncharacterized protein CELE_Y39B6A.43 [Caenorhabditis elegans]
MEPPSPVGNPEIPSEIPKNAEKTVYKYIDEQGIEIFIEDPIYVEENGNTMVYGNPYDPTTSSQEIYEEEIVDEEYVDSLPSTSSSSAAAPPPSKRARLIKDGVAYPSNTVLLTNQSLEAKNATFLAKAGARREEKEPKKQIPMINKHGSILNRNLPGMTNMFKVMAESALAKTDEMIKQEAMNNTVEEVEKDNSSRFGLENEESDQDGQSDTPPPMERLGEADDFQPTTTTFDQWPLYSNRAIDFKEACEILIGIQEIDEEKVCKTVPLQFKHEGTFLINTENGYSIIGNDDNGKWDIPSGKTRFYTETADGNLIRADDGKGRLKQWTKEFTYKIILKKYDNQVTRGGDEGRGQFQRKIYTGFKGAGRLPFSIVTYSWHAGRPWNFVPPVTSRQTVRRPNWEKKSYEKVNMTSMPQMVSAYYEGFNIYSHCIVSFDEATAIMLGATPIDTNKLCSSVPLGYRQNGTFVIDLKRMGHCLLELRRDDNGIWNKPSGFSRFYKISENGDAIRVDKAGKLPAGMDYDVKIASKRYEHTQVQKNFVRKIYTAKGKNSESFPGSPEYAVIVYYWKGEPIQFEPAFKQNGVRTESKEYSRYQQIADEEQEFVEATGSMDPVVENLQKNLAPSPPPLLKRVTFPPEPQQSTSSTSAENLHELKLQLIRREMQNQDRFSAVLDRADGLLARMEQRFGVEHHHHIVHQEQEEEVWDHEQIIEEEEVIVQDTMEY